MGIFNVFRRRKLKKELEESLAGNSLEMLDDIIFEFPELLMSLVQKSNVESLLLRFANEEPGDIIKLVSFALKNGGKIDNSQVIANNSFLLDDLEICKYCTERGFVSTYELLKKHPDAKIDFNIAVDNDIRCMEFAPINNPHLYVKAIEKIYGNVVDEYNTILEIINGNSSLPQEEQERIMNLIHKNNNYFGFDNDKLKAKYMEFIDTLKTVIAIINGERKVAEGKYHIPEIELFNGIKNFVKNYTLYHTNFNTICSDCNRKGTTTDELMRDIRSYVKYDGFYDRTFGEEFAKLYFDPAIILGIHNTDKHNPEELESYFNKGLIGLSYYSTVEGNVVLQENKYGDKRSLAVLLSWQHDMHGKYNIIFKFPRLLAMNEGTRASMPGEWSPLIDRQTLAIPTKYIYGAYEPLNSNTTIIYNPLGNEEHSMVVEERED